MSRINLYLFIRMTTQKKVSTIDEMNGKTLK